MKTVSKKIIPKAEELLNEEHLAVKYLRENRMSFHKVIGQLNFHLSNAL